MKNFFKEWLEQYLVYIEKVRGYSEATLRTYRLNLEEALKSVGIEVEGNRIRLDLMPYRMKLINLNKRTIYKKISIVRAFVAYLRENGVEILLVNDDPIKLPKSLPKPISLGHIEAALQRCNLEERVLVLLLFTLGLRISELANLKLEDIKEEWVRINGKGAKIRDVPILKRVYLEVVKYREMMMPKTYLFEKKGMKLTENQMRYRIGKIFAKTGIKATPHQLRHAFATEMLAGGAKITDVSALLGHSALETTQIYTGLSSRLKLRNYQKAHPMCQESLNGSD
ncbi:MAG: hypothetical protein B6D59_04610 [Campylobacteraceae bacterium 4484_4]|nr:MAG: hypothetical protein B6D59_04610 [Campylobacteraceae bacterium 4484_4]